MLEEVEERVQSVEVDLRSLQKEWRDMTQGRYEEEEGRKEYQKSIQEVREQLGQCLDDVDSEYLDINNIVHHVEYTCEKQFLRQEIRVEVLV